MLVRMNHLELTTESKRSKLSIMRFCTKSAKVGSHRWGPNVEICLYLTALLQQYLVVLAQGHTENDGRDILKTMNPLFALTPLSTNVEHATKRQSPKSKQSKATASFHST